MPGLLRRRRPVRKHDGYMSTPTGVHDPIEPGSFSKRVDEWRIDVETSSSSDSNYAEVMEQARAGDLVYCDPPYVDTQAILYAVQAFSLSRLFAAIKRCKSRGVFVALSIDGTKRSGDKICNIPIPDDLFETEALVNCGRSMLRRFQMAGQTLENEVVRGSPFAHVCASGSISGIGVLPFIPNIVALVPKLRD